MELWDVKALCKNIIYYKVEVFTVPNYQRHLQLHPFRSRQLSLAAKVGGKNVLPFPFLCCLAKVGSGSPFLYRSGWFFYVDESILDKDAQKSIYVVSLLWCLCTSYICHIWPYLSVMGQNFWLLKCHTKLSKTLKTLWTSAFFSLILLMFWKRESEEQFIQLLHL